MFCYDIVSYLFSCFLMLCFILRKKYNLKTLKRFFCLYLKGAKTRIEVKWDGWFFIVVNGLTTKWAWYGEVLESKWPAELLIWPGQLWIFIILALATLGSDQLVGFAPNALMFASYFSYPRNYIMCLMLLKLV